MTRLLIKDFEENCASIERLITFVISDALLFDFNPNSRPQYFFLNTDYNWVGQTYLRLRNQISNISISDKIPRHGIIVAFAGSLPPGFRPTGDQYLVSVSADGPAFHYADMHIVQNRHQTRYLRNAHFVPHWPQPGLIPRRAERGVRFETVAYFGDGVNLAPELRADEWRNAVEALGLAWRMVGPDDAHLADYSDVDATIAVRSFERKGFIRKPASKLVNSWLAGIPAIAGCEYAFREVGSPGHEYLEARSYAECVAALRRLRDDVDLRRQLVEDGRTCVRKFAPEAVAARWLEVLRLAADAGARKRVESRLRSRCRNLLQWEARKRRGLRHKIMQRVGYEHNVV